MMDNYLEVITVINAKVQLIGDLIDQLRAEREKLLEEYNQAKAKHDA